MKALSARVDRLEDVHRQHGGNLSRLVLLAPRGELTAEQQAQAAAARQAGREVFTIIVAAREGGAPCGAC